MKLARVLVCLLMFLTFQAHAQYAPPEFDETVLYHSYYPDAVVVGDEVNLETIDYVEGDPYGEPLPQKNITDQSVYDYDWGWAACEWAMFPSTGMPGRTLNDPTDWIRWTAYWDYMTPPTDTVTVRVQIIWVGHYVPHSPSSGSPVKKTKTVVTRTYPGTSFIGAPFNKGYHQAKWIKFDGVAAMKANKPANQHGAMHYYYIQKMHIIRPSYGRKEVRSQTSPVGLRMTYTPTSP